MINHDYEKMSWHVDHIKRHIKHTRSAVEACITQGLTEYAEHQAKLYEARIDELEQDKDSQAILAAAKELGRVEVLDAVTESSVLAYPDESLTWIDNGVYMRGAKAEFLAYLDSRGEDV